MQIAADKRVDEQVDRQADKQPGTADSNGGPAAAKFTLALDIGGTGLKASVLDEQGNMVTDKSHLPTPHPCPPEVFMNLLDKLIAPLRSYDRVSAGFPGVVRKGRILTAPNLDPKGWAGFDLATALSQKLGKPAKVKNDADLQGLGAIRGEGIEMVVTLGTGVGTSLFEDGWIAPHLEFAHHPFRKGETYEEQLGEAALNRVGKKKWNRRLRRAIAVLRALTTFNHLYLGGGNSRKIDFELQPDVEIVSNDFGMRGGIWLWRRDRGLMGREPESNPNVAKANGD
ncbi:MAG TPA: ROK family protein [Pirellulales bacterium]|nr:ROK family protein [Pirellulales bacterium]